MSVFQWTASLSSEVQTVESTCNCQHFYQRQLNFHPSLVCYKCHQYMLPLLTSSIVFCTSLLQLINLFYHRLSLAPLQLAQIPTQKENMVTIVQSNIYTFTISDLLQTRHYQLSFFFPFLIYGPNPDGTFKCLPTYSESLTLMKKGRNLKK